MNNRKEQAEKVIKTYVKIEQVFRDFNSFSSQVNHRGDETLICCPFHHDELPSLSINDNRGKWHCFSCGRGGNVITAYVQLYHLSHGIFVKYDNAIDQLILTNASVKAMLDFTTVKEMDKPTLDVDFTPRRFKSVSCTVTMNDVVRLMRSQGKDNWAGIVQVNDLMLNGMSPTALLEFLNRQQSTDRKHMTTFSNDTTSVNDLLSQVKW